MFGIQLATTATASPSRTPAVRRDPRVAELLARLDIAVGQRNAPAAQRIIADLIETPDGEWLVRQCLSAGLRAAAGELSTSE